MILQNLMPYGQNDCSYLIEVRVASIGRQVRFFVRYFFTQTISFHTTTELIYNLGSNWLCVLYYVCANIIGIDKIIQKQTFRFLHKNTP